MASATDPVVIDAARRAGCSSAPTPTSAPCSPERTPTTPSFLLLRRASGRRAAEQAAIILSNLNVVQADLDAGAIVVLGEATLRIRRLPLGAPNQSG
jgi:hypothetical protein